MRLLVLTLALLLPVQALALSCMRYGVTDAYLDARDAKDRFLVVYGSLALDETRLPRSHQANTPARTVLPGHVHGAHWLGKGRSHAFDAAVEVEINCAGPWCPRVNAGTALMFLQETSTGYRLSASACGGFWFKTPMDAQITAVRDCLNGRACRPSEPRR